MALPAFNEEGDLPPGVHGATLSEVLTDESYAHLDRLAVRLRAALEATIAGADFAWHVVSVGAKGCVTFRAEPVREYRDFLGIDDRRQIDFQFRFVALLLLRNQMDGRKADSQRIEQVFTR